MPVSARARSLIAAGLVCLLVLSALGLVAMQSLQRRSEQVLERVERNAVERGAQRGAWEVLADLAPEPVRAALAAAEPRVALSRQLELWHQRISLDLIVFDAAGAPLAATPPELLEQTPRLGGPDGGPRVLLIRSGPTGPSGEEEDEERPLAGGPLDITHADGTAAATLSALPPAAAGDAPSGSLGLVDPPLLAFLGAIVLAIVALLAFLVRTTDRLERAEAMRRTLVADAGHELRTPLTNLRCQLEAVQDQVAPVTPELLRSLHEETMLLARLVDDLRDLAAAEAGELGLRRGPVGFADVAERTAQAMAASFAAAEVALRLDVPADLPLLDADPDRLGQVLRNLLDNARRHTPACGCVTLRARREGSALAFVVSDTGPGIRPDVLPTLFERSARHLGGSGLGLAIVRSLVEAHGGTVGVESAAGTGARFTVRWPSPASR